MTFFVYSQMRGRGRVSKARGRVQLPASASQEDANRDDGHEHEAHIPRAPTGLGDTELQIWVPLASSVQPSHIDRSYTPVAPSADAQLPRPLPPPHRHSLHPHHPPAAPRPPVSHTHSPHSASPSGTASARGTGSASASTPSSAPASAPASAASTTAVGGTQSFRQTISLINNNLHPSEMCSRRITLIVKERLVEEGHCWKTVPNETKEFYWQEFKKYFLWDQAIESLVKIAWQKKAAERYRGLMWEIRKGKAKNLATPDYVLRKWQETWNTSEYKEKCEKFSANRRSEAGGSGSGISRHACGSISQYTHQRRMRERLGREPHPHELFEATHKRKGTEEFVDARSKAIYDKYVELKEAATHQQEGSNEPTPINEAQLYYEAVGGQKKSRVYGLGSQASAYFHEPAHCSASYTSAPPVDPPTIETMNRMQNKIDRLETENSRITTRLDELQTFMHRMMAQQGIGTSTQTSGPTPPPAPSPQQRRDDAPAIGDHHTDSDDDTDDELASLV
ncbi:uncharacterized protein LOC122721745 [Manihot esculenta]|uniref:uncharacterized protein LOC122721745 n=1 Tax=Manihot esculenta TaxID=3983 RepID=UPI001CC72F21|nr:uncharacterized protein LOC122721745 [Manihot esculenta]